MLSKVKPASVQELATIQAAKEELEAGVKALEARQKLICIADWSELGWQVVEAYKSDELASRDEDAKEEEEAGE